ncbi:hypothetical protein M1403_00965 [Patescibacteria group bacterium]|nr:hypothetical protein [Patescibacteria group bacterium]
MPVALGEDASYIFVHELPPFSVKCIPDPHKLIAMTSSSECLMAIQLISCPEGRLFLTLDQFNPPLTDFNIS